MNNCIMCCIEFVNIWIFFSAKTFEVILNQFINNKPHNAVSYFWSFTLYGMHHELQMLKRYFLYKSSLGLDKVRYNLDPRM